MTAEERAQLRAAAAAIVLGVTLAAIGLAGWATWTLGVALIAAAALTTRRDP